MIILLINFDLYFGLKVWAASCRTHVWFLTALSVRNNSRGKSYLQLMDKRCVCKDRRVTKGYDMAGRGMCGRLSSVLEGEKKKRIRRLQILLQSLKPMLKPSKKLSAN